MQLTPITRSTAAFANRIRGFDRLTMRLPHRHRNRARLTDIRIKALTTFTRKSPQYPRPYPLAKAQAYARRCILSGGRGRASRSLKAVGHGEFLLARTCRADYSGGSFRKLEPGCLKKIPSSARLRARLEYGVAVRDNGPKKRS